MADTRAEHLTWCKKRALEYVDAGDLPNAFVSMVSDLGKHPETEMHAGLTIGTVSFFSGHLNSAQEMRDFIEGFN